jgi:hypothetical protein
MWGTTGAHTAHREGGIKVEAVRMRVNKVLKGIEQCVQRLVCHRVKHSLCRKCKPGQDEVGEDRNGHMSVCVWVREKKRESEKSRDRSKERRETA